MSWRLSWDIGEPAEAGSVVGTGAGAVPLGAVAARWTTVLVLVVGGDEGELCGRAAFAGPLRVVALRCTAAAPVSCRRRTVGTVSGAAG
jgi:hypothetical protein